MAEERDGILYVDVEEVLGKSGVNVNMSPVPTSTEPLKTKVKRNNMFKSLKTQANEIHEEAVLIETPDHLYDLNHKKQERTIIRR